MDRAEAMRAKASFMEVQVTDSQTGMRLDLVLFERWNLSRRVSRSLCERGLVKVNGRAARRGLILRVNDIIQVEEDACLLADSDERKAKVALEAKRVKIVYEDPYMLVLSKPRMMHSVSLATRSDVSLAECLYSILPEVRPELDRGENSLLVQRLDYYTSGVVLAGRSLEIKQRIFDSLQAGDISKSYLALLAGEFTEDECAVDSDIFLVPNASKVFLEHTGKRSRCFQARSVFSAILKLESISGQSVATLALVQGEAMRRHQVRVHAKALGFPLVGDEIYGDGSTRLSDYFLGDYFLGDYFLGDFPPGNQFSAEQLPIGAALLPGSRERVQLRHSDSLLGEGFLLHAVSLALAHPVYGSRLKIVDRADYLAECFLSRGIELWSSGLLARI